MITVLILVLLAWTFYIGYARGLVLQLFYSVSSLLAFLLAGQFYQGISKTLSLWVPYASATKEAVMYFYPTSQLFDLDQVFYAGLAFFAIFSFLYLVARFLGIFAHLLPTERLDRPAFKLLAGLLAMGVTLFVLQMGLTILATVPMAFVQNHLQASPILRLLIHLPGTEQVLHYLWVTKIIGG